MPTLKQPASLVEFCMDFTLKKFHKIRKSCEKRGVSMAEECRYLTPSVRELIINKGVEMGLPSQRLIPFLGRRIRIFEASKLSKMHIQLSGFFETCQGIEEINLEGCRLHSEDLCVIFRNLKVVKRINLAKTNCCNDVVETICKNCCLLTDINLKQTSITHRGLQCLFSECTTAVPRCPLLETINVNVHVFASHRYSFLCTFLLTIPKLSNNCPVNNLALERFENSYKLFSEHDEAIAGITLSPPGDISDERRPINLPSLLNLAKDRNVLVDLTSLVILSLSTEFRTIFKLLEDAGNHLTELVLFSINNLDLSLISGFFPNLHSFHIEGCECLPFNHIKSKGCFKKLRKLNIKHTNNDSWKMWLQDILMCSSIEVLALRYIEEFGDEKIKWMVSTPSIFKLNKLNLEGLPITGDGLWKLVLSGIPLSDITVLYEIFDEALSENINKISEHIRMTNLNIKLKYSAVSFSIAIPRH